MSKKVLVIGAGIGGITTAIHLGRKGLNVKIVEKNSHPGGRCSSFIKDGHRFDIGATLLMMTGIYEKTWESFGRDLYKELDLIRMDPIYSVKFHGQKQILFSSDLTMMQHQLETVEKGSFEKFLKYMDQSFRTYQLSMKYIIDRNFNKFTEFFNLKNLFLLFRLRAFNNHYSHTAKYFKSDFLRVVFTFQNIYVGQDPYKASAIFAMLPFLELTDGVWFPRGGMSKIVENLVLIAKQFNVEFEYNKPVDKIIVNGRKVNGIQSENGEIEHADVVIANADLPYVYDHLLPDKATAKKIENLDYTCSAFIFHFGMNKVYPQFEQHNVFVSKDYKQNIDAIFTQKKIPEDVSFYVHAPSRKDISSAPENQDTISIIVPVGRYIEEDKQDWNKLKKIVRDAVITRLKTEGLTDFEEHIKFETCYNPKTWESLYNISFGSVFGSLSHSLMQMGYMRPHNQHRKYKNLFFVGGSTHPGNGIPMVLLSAKLTSEKVFQYCNL
ncbi:MAG: phytoene desaturase [Bacteroidales bacterium]|nr:phytoene desaturase [Bacteroidales bacterium]MCF8404021.1 phytoene desaturase [Bacteroidales bacterium]